MRHLILSFAFAVLALNAARADVSVSGSNTVVSAGGIGGTMTVGVTGDEPAPPVTENLIAWQLTLKTLPDAGARGSVGFSTIAPAPSYVLDGINFGIRSSISTKVTASDSLLVFDLNFPFTGGVPVPLAPGSGLVNITFEASPGASGTFGLYATPGTGNSEWTMNAGAGPTARDFANLPAGPDVRIGEITVVGKTLGPALTSINITQSGQVRLAWMALPGTLGFVEVSPDLINWSRFGDSPNAADETGHGSVAFERPISSRMYFRIVEAIPDGQPPG